MTQTTDLLHGPFPPGLQPTPESRVLELVIQVSPDFVGVSDTAGRPIYCNAAALQMVGLAWEEMLKTRVADYFVSEDQAFVNDVVLPTVHKEGRWAGELTFRHFKTGGRIPVLYSVFRIDDPATGQPSHFATITRDLRTEKVREAELHDAKQRVSFVQAATEVGTWTYHISADQVVADTKLLRLFGLDESQQAGGAMATFFNAIHPDDRPAVEKQLSTAIQDGSEFSAEYRITQADGTQRHVLARGKMESVTSGKPDRMPGVVIDVTERVRAEQTQRDLSAQLAHQAGLFDAVLSSITDYAFIFDRDCRVVYANRALLELWQRPMSEVAGKSMLELGYPPELAEKLKGQMRRVIETRQPMMDRTEYPSPDGNILVHEYIYAPVFRADDSVDFVAGSSRDITERQHFIDALERSERRLRQLADSVPQKVWMARPDGYRDSFNRRWYEFTGLAVGASDGSAWLEVVHPDDRAKTLARWQESVRSGAPFENELRIRHHSGQYRWTLSRALAIRDDRGEIERWFGSFTDIHEQRQAADALREGREQLALAVEAGQLGTWHLNLASMELKCSDRCKANFGLTPDAPFTYTDLHSQIHPDDRPSMEQALQTTLATKEAYAAEYRVLWPDGSVHWLSARGRYHSDDSSGARLVGVTTDITERKKNDAQREHLLEAERAARAEAERVGRMKDEFLATLSHELRTPLNAIFGWTQLLKSGADDPAEVAEAVDVIDRNVRVQIRLIEDLLDMSRIISGKLRLDIQQTTPAEFIEAAIDTLTPAASAKQIQLEKHLAAFTGTVSGDPARLQQVLWNLLSNAIKFTPTGGIVRVEMQCRDSQICISVSDTGSGIPREFLPHIFDRFRQADAAMNRKFGGLGLGLAISKQLVELHGGTICVESQGPGTGATFTVCLPTHHCVAPTEEAPANQTAEVSAPKSAAGFPDLAGVSVLIVDDERDAREFLRRVLADCRAEVCLAGSAKEALSILQHQAVHAMVSDIGMPECDGYELLKLTRALPESTGNQQIPAIAVTAFARANDRARAIAAGFAAHVAKPVDTRQLAQAILNALRANR